MFQPQATRKILQFVEYKLTISDPDLKFPLSGQYRRKFYDLFTIVIQVFFLSLIISQYATDLGLLMRLWNFKKNLTYASIYKFLLKSTCKNHPPPQKKNLRLIDVLFIFHIQHFKYMLIQLDSFLIYSTYNVRRFLGDFH